MQTLDEYISKTESAVKLLFEGIDRYLQILKGSPVPVFITSTPLGAEYDREFNDWSQENAEANAAANAARSEFLAESFALNTLCGALLQVACKAIECYSTNTSIPEHLRSVVKAKKAKYCVGIDRAIRSVPLGLIVYAARNQHTHFNDSDLDEPNRSVFELLATAHEYAASHPFRDPAFDLTNPSLTSYAANVTALIGWRDYAAYEADLRRMLNGSA